MPASFSIVNHALVVLSFFRCLLSCHEDFRYNIDAVDILIRSGLVSLQQYDAFLSSVIENGLNSVAVSFAMQLLQRLCIEEKHPSNGISEVGSLCSCVGFFNLFYVLGYVRQRTLSRCYRLKHLDLLLHL